jgi:hypothetical protein
MKKSFLSLLSLFTLLILILSLTVVILFLRYKSWEDEFEKNMDTQYVIVMDDVKGISFNEKLVQFVLSSSDTEFLQLEVKEVGVLILATLDQYMQEGFTVERIYIDPYRSKWNIYCNIKYESISIWVSLDINKDDIQSAQIYTKNVYLGPFNVSKYFNIENLINKGIGESIVTLNENGFVGRYIENIELLEDTIVLKGSRY